MTVHSNITFQKAYIKLCHLCIYCTFLNLLISSLVTSQIEKTCPGVDVVHADNIDSFKGCNVIEGSIRILDTSFNGFQQIFPNFTFGTRHAKMHPSKLEVFDAVKEITGCVMIEASQPEFTNLFFFRNLQQIGGKHDGRTRDVGALYIKKTSLKSLNLLSLKQVSSGNIIIENNEKLCFVNTVNYRKILKTSSQTYVVRNNGICNAEKCDSQCSEDGCWGALPNDCLSCKAYRLNCTCVEKCDPVNGVYDAGNYVCEFCHEECLGSCSGPGNENCTYCVNVRNGRHCVSKCPDTKCNLEGKCTDCPLSGNDKNRRRGTDEGTIITLLLEQQNEFLKAIARQYERLADAEQQKTDTFKELTASIKYWVRELYRPR